MRRESESNMLSAPPRLLLGVAFLFWGGMHDQAVAGLIAAALVEGRFQRVTGSPARVARGPS